MTNATETPIQEIEQAAIPEAIAIVNALEAADQSMGSDPTQWPLKWPGVKMSLIGAVMQQFPVLAVAEGGVVQNVLSEQFTAWKTKLQQLQQRSPSATPTAS